MSILPLNPHLIANPIVKLHHCRNLHPCHTVVTYKIAVLNHGEVKKFKQEIIKKWLVKVKNHVYDGIDHKSFCLQKWKKQYNCLSFSLFYSPPSFLECFCISQQEFRSMIVLKGSLHFCKFVPYKLGTFS